MEEALNLKINHTEGRPILFCPHCVFLVVTSVLKYPEQVINETKIEVQSYALWQLGNEKVDNFITIFQQKTLF